MGHSSAVAQCGIARTRDLKTWERLADLKSKSPQQRNVVLHPEFVDGQYAFSTRPQDDLFRQARAGALAGACQRALRAQRSRMRLSWTTGSITDSGSEKRPRSRTDQDSQGWLHFAHGVRNTAAGLRYVLYLFLAEWIGRGL